MSDTTDRTPEAVEHLATRNLGQFTTATRELVTAILAVAEQVFGEGSTKKWEGSGSVLFDGKAVAKGV